MSALALATLVTIVAPDARGPAESRPLQAVSAALGGVRRSAVVRITPELHCSTCRSPAGWGFGP